MSGNRHARRGILGACAAAALAFLPAHASAQVDPGLVQPTSPFFVGVDAGPVLPGTELGDLADPGLRIGGEFGWQATERVAFKIDGGADLLQDQDEPAAQTDMRLFHYGAGMEVMLTRPDAYRRWDVAATLGAGATTIDAEAAAVADAELADFDETYPRANAGLAVSFQPTSSIELELRGEAYVAFADEDETAILTGALPGVDPLDRAVTYPITLAVDWRLPSD